MLKLTHEFHQVKSEDSGSEGEEDWVGSEDSDASQPPTGDQGQAAAGGPGGDDDPSSDSSSGGSREPSNDDESSNEGWDAVPEPSETALKKEVAKIPLDLANARERILTLEAANITQKLAYSVKAIDYTKRLDRMEEKATKAAKEVKAAVKAIKAIKAGGGTTGAPPTFTQRMMRSLAKGVADIIGVNTYATQEDVKDHAKLHDLNNPKKGTPFASIYKVADQVDTLDRELRGPAGMMAKIDQRTTALENK